MKNVKPLGNRVLLKKIKEEQTQGGIILPDSAKGSQDTRAVVVAVGDDVKTLEEGNKVVTTQYTGTPLNGGEYVIAKEEEIEAIVLD